MPESRVRACNECRQQKLRCDAHKHLSNPCSRCQRMGLRCVISESFQRSKRQSKADLRKEISHLKAALLSGDAHGSTLRAPDRSTSSEPTALSLHTGATPGSSASVSPGDSVADPSMVLPSPRSDHAAVSATSRPDASTTILCGVSASPQSIDGYLVEGSKIVDCFTLFYQNYAPWLPGMFDQTITPDEHYQNSPLLFWAIVGTGARRYKRDPTIFDRITKRFTEKLLSLVCVMHNPSAAVQALVVLCMWPLPVTTLFKDPSPAWAGMATSLAIQAGLHAICKEEEFARKPATRRPLVGMPAARFVHSDASPATNSARAKIAFRTSLWINCLISCQSTMMCDGLLPITVPTNEDIERQQLITYMVSEQLYLRYRLHVVQTDAVAAIRRTIDLESVSCGAELISLINIFDKQLNNITTDCSDSIGIISRDCTRLMILCFHFFVQTEQIDRQGFLQVFNVSQQVILRISELDATHGFVEYLPIYYARMVVLAAYCILRISKSELRDELKLDDAGGVFFKAIEISRRRSVQHGDLDALNSIMLTKLWSSNEIFVQPDGTRNSLQLDLRGRLAMSVAFDCFWWWRKEFGYLFNDSIPASEGIAREDGVIDSEEKSKATSAGTSNQTMAGDHNLAYNAVDFSDYSDWDWSIGLTPFESVFGLTESSSRGLATAGLADPVLSMTSTN